jgi:hypothetical protein
LRKLFPFILLLFCLSGCGTAPTQALTSGVEGHVTVGPTCPVVKLDNPCPDKPYQASLTILEAGGNKILQTVQTGPDGFFHLPLAPGSYLLRPQTPGKYPSAREQPFTVQPGKFTRLDITYDSGIR